MPAAANVLPARITVIGDRIDSFEPQDAIESAIGHAAHALDIPVPDVVWLSTDDLAADGPGRLDGSGAVWCAPGGPFRSLEGALEGIRWAREAGVPFLGTCAGFQHAVVEFARNVLGYHDAAHAEYTAHAEHDNSDNGALFIDELLCSLAGQTMQVELVDDELARLYGTAHPIEKYYCRFGVNPRWQQPLHDAGLRIAGIDERDGDVRVMRLEGHPFFVLTLFVPQTSSTGARPHPLITAYVRVVGVPRPRRPVSPRRLRQWVPLEEVPDRLRSIDLRRRQAEPR